VIGAAATGNVTDHRIRESKTTHENSTRRGQPECYRYDIDLAEVSKVWRRGSGDLDHFANQVLSAMRKGFGGHAERPAG